MLKILKNLFLAWIEEPAEWYEFWMPGSGRVGGAIMGVVLVVILINLGAYS